MCKTDRYVGRQALFHRSPHASRHRSPGVRVTPPTIIASSAHAPLNADHIAVSAGSRQPPAVAGPPGAAPGSRAQVTQIAGLRTFITPSPGKGRSPRTSTFRVRFQLSRVEIPGSRRRHWHARHSPPARLLRSVRPAHRCHRQLCSTFTATSNQSAPTLSAHRSGPPAHANPVLCFCFH